MVMSGRAIAHRRQGDGATHDLEEHLRAAALLAGRFAEVWGASETAALAALWHDLGKYATEFQAMITASDPEAHLEGVAGEAGQSLQRPSALGDGTVPKRRARPSEPLPHPPPPPPPPP